jgi:Pvc16 N-terminal domain
MSTELAVTAVTQALRDILTKEVPQKWGVDVLSGDLQKQLFVEALPPHKVRDHHATENVLNVFLYRTEVNAAWRNHALPVAGKTPESATPPLALNLEYLITAYGEDDREEVAHFFLASCTTRPSVRGRSFSTS